MPLVTLYLAAMLAGFGLIIVGFYAQALGLAFLATISTVLVSIGVITVIVFAFALIYLGVRALLNKHFD